MITCLECGKDFKQITITHLKKCCNLSTKEYKLKYPNTKLADLAGEKNPRYKGEKYYCEKCGIKLARKRISNKCQRCQDFSGEKNPFYNKTHTLETREKMSINHADFKGDKNPFYNKTHTKKVKQKISTSKKRFFSNLSKPERTKFLYKWIKAGCSKKNTSIEIAVENILNELKIFYIKNAYIQSYFVDFLIDDSIIIECYGDYWHCNPKYYNSVSYNKSLKMLAIEKWNKDKIRINNLSENYTCVIFWEDDIKNDLTKVKNEIYKLVA